MKTHAAIGSKILAGSQFRMMQLADEIANFHHEKWDGSGYHGVAGANIPAAARIVALADVFDVLTHSRPYKQPWPVEEAIGLIERERGRHFDPTLVDLFLDMIRTSSLVVLGTALAADNPAEAHGIPVFVPHVEVNVPALMQT